MQALDVLQLIPGLYRAQPPQYSIQIRLGQGAHVPDAQGDHFRLLIDRKDVLDVERFPRAQDQLKYEWWDRLALGPIQVLPHAQAHEPTFPRSVKTRNGVITISLLGVKASRASPEYSGVLSSTHEPQDDRDPTAGISVWI